MARLEIYVDPLNGSNSNGGTSDGDAYLTTEFAIINRTFDLTDGVRVNIKDTGPDTIAASLEVAMANTSVSIAWAPGISHDLIFQGYTSVAGDGGMGILSGGGLVGIISGVTYTHFIDMHITNSGTNPLLDMDQYSSILRCELDTCASTVNAVRTDSSGVVYGCHIHTITGTGTGLKMANSYLCLNNIIDVSDAPGPNGAGGIDLSGNGCVVSRNIVITAPFVNAPGIGSLVHGGAIINNSVYSTGSPALGISVSGSSRHSGVCSNNLVEGFSTGGGVGISINNATGLLVMVGNAVFDCVTPYANAAGDIFKPLGWENDTQTNETLSASPFVNAPADMAPVDTGGVKEGSQPDVVGI